MPIRFLHVADLHLGLRITRFEESACSRIGEARFEAIEQLRMKAVEHQVQFLLVAGDVFDDQSVSRTISERAFTLFEGQGMPCPVYIIPGNHDPLTPGGVWDREPWQRQQPMKHVRVLREAIPVDVPGLPVTLFPCPLRHRNSIDDPTSWIRQHPRSAENRKVRIGLAHGSLNMLPNLPPDDHPIRPDAAEFLDLDYLALGHWHRHYPHPSADRVVRAAYSGTHEPMRFPGTSSSHSTGWSSFSSDSDQDRFNDEGRGTALLVTIDEPGAPPIIEKIEIGRLRWVAELHDVSARSLGDLISDYGQRDDRALTILRLKLSGVTDVKSHGRIDEVLREIVCNRYYPGSSLDADDVLLEPQPEHLRELVGNGVLSRVLERLQTERESADESTRRTASQALKLLYRIAWEGQSA